MTNNEKESLEERGSEESLEQRETAGLSQSQIVIRRFVRHRAAMTSLIVLAFIILFVFTAGGIQLGSEEAPFRIPGWWNWTITYIPDFQNDGAPTLDVFPAFIDGTGMQIGAHPFGQDTIGKDYFALVMRGAQQSITVMFVIGIVAAFIGTVLGAVSGFFGKWVDQLIMRFTDLIITVPALIVGAVIGIQIGNLGVFMLALFLGLFTWTEEEVWLRIVAFSAVALVAVLVWLMMRSPWGRVMKGIREDEDAVRSLGKNVFAFKMQSLIIGGVLGAIGGMFYVLPTSVQPDALGRNMTFLIWTAMLLGGAATIWGPVLGSILFFALRIFIQGTVDILVPDAIMNTQQTEQFSWIMVGVALMLLVIFRPQGILGDKKELNFNV